MSSFLNKFTKFLYRSPETAIQVQQVRHRFVDWRMLKDFRKRQVVEKHGKDRLRLVAMKRNKVLPPELQSIVSEEVAAFPRDSCPSRIRARCVVTSRARGFITEFRVSRIAFRHLADYNKLAGVMRAKW